MKNATTPKKIIVSEEILDKKLETWSKQVIQSISDIFYGKFGENDNRWEENDKKWDEANLKFDKLALGQDRILKELVDMRDENTGSILHFERNDKSISTHEKRITALEIAKN